MPKPPRNTVRSFNEYAAPTLGPQLSYSVSHRLRLYPSTPGKAIAPGVPNALVALKSHADIRSKRSVGPGCTSQRRPRLIVSRSLARQSFCEYIAKYFCENAGVTFAPGRIHQTPVPSSIPAALTPRWALVVTSEATPPLAVAYWKLKLPPEWANGDGIATEPCSGSQ